MAEIAAENIATTRPTFDIEDMYIAGLEAVMDGPSGVLGVAGPKYGRLINGVMMTTVGVMRFDTADIPGMIEKGTWESVIVHEMGHVIGIGTLWGVNGLAQTDSTGISYQGPNALQQWSWSALVPCQSKPEVERERLVVTLRSNVWMASS